MKEQIKKEREIYVIGRPSLEHLSPSERKVFFSTLLQCVIEHFKENNEETDKNNQFQSTATLYWLRSFFQVEKGRKIWYNDDIESCGSKLYGERYS